MQSEFLIRNLIYFVSITLNLILGFFILLKGRKERANRIFFVTLLFTSGWLISLFLFYAIESLELVLWIGRINFAFVLPMLYFLLRFVVVFPKEIIIVPKKLRRGLLLWVFFLTLLTTFTPLVDKQEIVTALGQRKTIYGPLYTLYVFHYIILSVIVLALLFYKLRKLKEKIEKSQVTYILIGLSLSLAFGFITNIFLYSIGLFEAANYGPISVVIFSIFVTAAIFKHYLFNIKILAVELFTALLIFLLFVNIFLAPTLTQRILNIIILGGGFIFGIGLIRSVIKEIELREKTQKLASDLEEAYRELKKLDEAKTEFISIASHQLRTPLTIIKGYISMLMEGSYGELPDKTNKPLKNVFDSNERLIRLVNDLLTVSKVETGRIEVEFGIASIEEIISSLVDELELRAKEKGIYIKWEKPKAPLPKLMIDKEKIRQAILNILDNATHYTEKGGITIKIKALKSRIQIIISDTGEGMTKKEAEKLFTSFSRGSAGVRLWAEGAGLGLYIARRFVDFHKGKIWAESPGKGKGSTFYIELPMKLK